MSFQDFDAAVEAFKSFLHDQDLPTDLLWLVRTRVHWTRAGLSVFQPSELTDNVPHRQRFDAALQQNKNIALCVYATYDQHSLVSIETPGLENDLAELGSHNLRTLTDRPKVVAVRSRLRWRLLKWRRRQQVPSLTYCGWPD